MSPRAIFSGATLALACAGSRPAPVAPAPPPAPTVTSVSLPPLRVEHPGWNSPAPTPLPRRARGLSAEAAQPVLATTNGPVRACFRALLTVNPTAQGTLTTMLRVGADGNVTDVETIGAPEPSLALLQPCVFGALRSRRFPASRGPALFSFAFSFRPGEATGDTPPVAPAQAQRPGVIAVANPETLAVGAWQPSLTPNAAPSGPPSEALVAASLEDLRALSLTCYTAALAVAPDAEGDLSLRLEVSAAGSVSRVEVTEARPFAAPIRDCIQVLGTRLRFHPAYNPSAITIPITLARSAPAEPAPAPSGTPVGTPTTPPVDLPVGRTPTAPQSGER
ncbi:MAG: hypothetical protein HY909_28170 [Deltaproteobacteria bacterium]|nr:hypothetical protein [Deltaproteobacteria bacterium]